MILHTSNFSDKERYDEPNLKRKLSGVSHRQDEPVLKRKISDVSCQYDDDIGKIEMVSLEMGL